MSNGKKLEYEIDATDKSKPALDSASSHLRKAGDDWLGTMKGIGAGISAAWGAIKLGEIISDSMQFGDVEAHIQAELGTLPAETESLGRIAGQVWVQGFTGSLSEVSGALVLVKRQISGLDDAALGTTTTKVLALSSAFYQDVSSLTKATSTMLQTGLADSADQALDVLTRGLQSSANKGGDLLDVLSADGAVFQQLGLDGATSLGLLSQGMDAGASSATTLGTALKTFLANGEKAVIDTKALAAAQAKAKTASEALTKAQQSERTAQLALNTARTQATADLKDLADQLDASQFDEQGAALAVARAQQRMQEVMADSGSSMLDRSEAQYAYEQAQRQLADQQAKTDELATEQAKADKTGVEGSDKVIAAKAAVTEAHQKTTAAVKEYSDAQASAAKRLTPVGKAFEKLGLDAASAQRDLAAGGPAAEKVLTQVFAGLRNIKDPAEKSNIATTLFGKSFKTLQSSIFALDPATAAKKFSDIGGAADQVVSDLAESPTSRVQSLQRGWQLWVDGLINTKGPIGDVAVVMSAFGGTIISAAVGLGPLALAMGGMGGAAAGSSVGLGAMAAGLWATTLPILAVIAAIALVAAGVYLIVTNWDTIGPWLAGLWDGIAKTASGVWDGITKWWGGVWQGIGDAAGKVWDGIKLAWSWSPLGAIVTNWDKISGFFGGAANSIGKFFTDAFRNIANMWNSTLGSLAWTVPDWVPLIGGQTWSVPKLPVPALAQGGIVTGPTLALIGEAGDEAVVPLDRWDGGGGDRVIVVQIDGREVARAVDREHTRRR